MNLIERALVCCVFALGMPSAGAAEPEVLLGISTDFEKQELTIQVSSSGCTAKADFQFELKGETLTVRRKKRDACKAMEEAVRFTYALKEIGVEPNKPFRLGNKLIANPFLARVR